MKHPIKKLLILIICICTSSYAYAFRSGLDFTFMLSVGGVERTKTCDLCSYAIRERGISFQTRSVNSAKGYVEVLFFRDADRKRTGHTALLSFEGVVGKGPLNQLVRLYEGQTLIITGTDIRFTLIKTIGPGCPKGMAC